MFARQNSVFAQARRVNAVRPYDMHTTKYGKQKTKDGSQNKHRKNLRQIRLSMHTTKYGSKKQKTEAKYKQRIPGCIPTGDSSIKSKRFRRSCAFCGFAKKWKAVKISSALPTGWGRGEKKELLTENRRRRRNESSRKNAKPEQGILGFGSVMSRIRRKVVQALGQLVSLNCTHYCASIRDLSNS